MIRKMKSFALDQTANPRIAVERQGFHALRLLLNRLERDELAGSKERLETRSDQLAVHFFASCLCSSYVKAYVVIRLGEHEVVQAKQATVDRGSRFDLECLANYVLGKPKH